MALSPPVTASSGSGGGTSRDNPVWEGSTSAWRRWLRNLGIRRGGGTQGFTLEGSAVGAATTIPLAFPGSSLAMEVGAIAVPVGIQMQAVRVAVSWLAGTPPSGEWTLTLFRRAGAGGDLSAAATFTVDIS